MKRRIGILTSGGDCPGLNAAIRGVAKASYGMFDCEIVGIEDGYQGLIDGRFREMNSSDFSGILTRGGTILGTHRTPFKKMRKIEEDGIDKVKAMIKTYDQLKLDCLVTLGGNGTHKNANLLRGEGLNVIGLPKTIDNDIWGTDVTFGFHSALDIATEVVDRIHTTADSHDRVMIIELMGHRQGQGHSAVSYNLAKIITERTGMETRVTIPGHQQRGGSPSPYDRVLSTTLGAFAAEMIANKDYGKTISIINNRPKTTPLEEMASKLKIVTKDEKLLTTARLVGVSFG